MDPIIKQIYLLWLYGAEFKIFDGQHIDNLYLIKFRGRENNLWRNVDWLKPR